MTGSRPATDTDLSGARPESRVGSNRGPEATYTEHASIMSGPENRSKSRTRNRLDLQLRLLTTVAMAKSQRAPTNVRELTRRYPRRHVRFAGGHHLVHPAQFWAVSPSHLLRRSECHASSAVRARLDGGCLSARACSGPNRLLAGPALVGMPRPAQRRVRWSRRASRPGPLKW